jgi:hypothetical protein
MTGRTYEQQRQWTAVRRMIGALVVTTAFLAVAFAAQRFQLRALGLIALAGAAVSTAYGCIAYLGVLRAWLTQRTRP